MSEDYKPNSLDAVLSRIETKLDSALKVQGEHEAAIQRLWRALNRVDVRVGGIAGAISGLAWIADLIWKHAAK